MSTPFDSPRPEPDLIPGAVLSDRYRLVACIGRGGMGDVWRADDLVLDAPVALKVMHVTSDEVRRRLLIEARLARQITHPAVCRVFDVGEANGRVFLSMELIEGEDLATLLPRVDRLPVERVLEIAVQLCGGLAAAHAQGVLHRDFKPANVLIDRQGRVRITDFGIATPEAGESQRTGGTPAYMAPEQLTRGVRLSEQTDLYALGVVLYELVTGRRPRETALSAQTVAPPSSLVAQMEPRLERIIMQALNTRPASRPVSAAAMATELEGQTGRAATWRLPWGVVAAVVGVVVGAVLAVSLLWRTPVASLSEQDSIVLATFANTTGEPVFDGTLNVALAVALEQSPFLKVFADERVRETLRLMNRPPETVLSRDVAREVAVREQLKALIAGSIASLGSHYVLTLDAIAAESGDVIAREQVEAASREDVLESLGGAARSLRERLGESLASVQRFDVALPRATTQSLEALHAYAQALDEGRLDPRAEAIPYLQRAIELDPNFAMAQAMLSGLYANRGQSALAPQYSARAFALRDRVSERERFVIAWRYYRDATQSWSEGLQLARSWAVTYPREWLAFNSLGFSLWTLGQYDAAIEPLEKAIELDPRAIAPPENLANSLVALHRYADAKQVLATAHGRQRYFIAQGRVSYLIAFLEHDEVGMTRALEEAFAQPDPSWAFDWQPRTAAFRGRLSEAHDGFQRGIALARRDRLDEFAAHYAAQDAEAHAVMGQCTEALAEARLGLATSRDNFTLERSARALAFCGALDEAQTIAGELRRRFPSATLVTGLTVPIIDAVVALRRNDPAQALRLLEPVRSYDAAPYAEFWPAFIRGEAQLALKDSRAARASFDSIVEHRGRHPDAVLYPLAQWRAAQTAALIGESARARQGYEAFLAHWHDADPALAPLVSARQELTRLP